MIDKGDRVRVHADGDVVRVARTEPLFEVLLPLGATWDKTRGMERERHQRERTAWFYTDEVEPTLDKPLVVGNGWRDVCADMIRDGNDHEAFVQMVINSQSVADYVRMLEALEEAFGKLPTATTFRETWKEIRRTTSRRTRKRRTHSWRCGAPGKASRYPP